MHDATRLYLFRHGEVDEAWRGRIYGDHDVPLSPRGERESHVAGARLDGLDLDAVVSSGLARAEHLAARVRRGRDLERRDDARLREIHRGAWVGKRPSELDLEAGGNAWQRWHRAPADERPPGGESLTDLCARVVPAVRELVERHPGGQVAIAAHSWVVRCLAARAMGLELNEVPRLTLATGSLVVLDVPADPTQRPTLCGYAVQRMPDPQQAWFRAPRR